MGRALLLVLLFPALSLATIPGSRRSPGLSQSISRAACQQISFDNRAYMAGESDQGTSKLCWAHVSALLIEEQLCLANKRNCGKKVSRTELATSTYMSNGEAVIGARAKEEDALRYAINRGNYQVCLEKYTKDPFARADLAIIERLRQTYRDAAYVQSSSCQSEDELAQVIRNSENTYNEIYNFLNDSYPAWNLGRKLTSRKYIDILYSAEGENDFIRRVLLFNCDSSNRLSFKRRGIGLRVVKQFMPMQKYLQAKGNPRRMDLSSHLQAMWKAKSQGHSVAIAVCGQLFLDGLDGIQYPKMNAKEFEASCTRSAHSLVVNAAKWNPRTNQCETYVMNSDMRAPVPNGWYPADIVLGHSMAITYYGKSGGSSSSQAVR